MLWLQRRSFFEKSTFSNKSGVKTRLGTILGRSGSPKGVVLGSQKGPKRHQKRDQYDIKILIDFWSDFGAILKDQKDPPTRPGGMRGACLDSLSSKNSKTNFEILFGHAPTLRVAADLIAQRAVRRARARRAPWTNRKAKAKQPQMEKR